MRTTECTREHDVVDAIAAGRWPDLCDAELREHVDSCAMCADVVLVASALQEEFVTARRAAHVPPAGMVWWRAQMRARQEAARVAERPITFVHAIAVASAIGGAAGLIGVMSPSLRRWITAFDFAAFTNVVTVPWSLPLVVVLSASLVLAPLAIYLVLSDK